MNTPAASIAQIKESLEGMLGKETYSPLPKTLMRYSRDTSLSPVHLPDMVVKVRNTGAVQWVLKIANANSYPVVPRSSERAPMEPGFRRKGD